MKLLITATMIAAAIVGSAATATATEPPSVTLAPVAERWGGRLSPDGTRALSHVKTRDRVDVWDTATGALLYSINQKTAALNFSPDGTLLAGWSSGTAVWDAANGREIAKYRSGAVARPYAFTADSSTLLVGVSSGITDSTYRIVLVDARTGAERATVAEGRGFLRNVALARDGNSVAILFVNDATKKDGYSGGYTLRVVAMSGAEILAPTAVAHGYEFGAETARPSAYDDADRSPMSADGSLIVVPTGLKKNIWTVTAFTLPGYTARSVFKGIAETDEYDSSGGFVGVSPDGRYAYSYGEGVGEVWDTATGKAVVPDLGNSAIVFLPDGKTILGGRRDQATDLISLADGKTILSLPGEFLSDVSADGKRAMTQDYDGTMRIYTLP